MCINRVRETLGCTTTGDCWLVHRNGAPATIKKRGGMSVKAQQEASILENAKRQFDSPRKHGDDYYCNFPLPEGKRTTSHHSWNIQSCKKKATETRIIAGHIERFCKGCVKIWDETYERALPDRFPESSTTGERSASRKSRTRSVEKGSSETRRGSERHSKRTERNKGRVSAKRS